MFFKKKNITAEKLFELYKKEINKNYRPAFLLNKSNYTASLPKEVIICDVRDNYGDNKFISIMSGDNNYYPQYVEVENDYEIQLASAKDSKRIMKDHDEYKVLNFDTNLGKYFSTGADPEIFVENDKGDIIPAFDFLGSKKDPNFAKKDANNHGGNAIYWDGPQAEFTTQPHSCLGWLVDDVKMGIEGVLENALKHNKNAKLSTKTVVELPQKVLQEAKKEHIELGCMPSFNIYDLKGKIVDEGRDLPYRSAGGHIHFGIGPKSKEEIASIVKALDGVLGVACVALFAKYDNPIRRQYYGLAGEYRLPAHGLEYRVLSNAWLFHPLIMNLVFDLARKVLVFGEKGFYKKLWKATEEETIECINNYDVKLAQKIMTRNKKIMIKLFKSSYSYITLDNCEQLFDIFYNGMDTAIEDAKDIAGNWNINKGEWVRHTYPQYDKSVHGSREKLFKGKKVS